MVRKPRLAWRSSCGVSFASTNDGLARAGRTFAGGLSLGPMGSPSTPIGLLQSYADLAALAALHAGTVPTPSRNLGASFSPLPTPSSSRGPIYRNRDGKISPRYELQMAPAPTRPRRACLATPMASIPCRCLSGRNSRPQLSGRTATERPCWRFYGTGEPDWS